MQIIVQLASTMILGGLTAAVLAAPTEPLAPVVTSPATPAITRPWPSAAAALGQTILLEHVRITPIQVVKDLRMGCVAPPGQLPQRLCVAHGWLDLRLRIEEPGRTRTLTLREMKPLAIGKKSKLGFIARPAQATGNPADYSFEFIIWPKNVRGPFDPTAR